MGGTEISQPDIHWQKYNIHEYLTPKESSNLSTSQKDYNVAQMKGTNLTIILIILVIRLIVKR